MAHLEDTEGGEDARDGKARLGDKLIHGGGIAANGVEDLLLQVVELKLGGVPNFGAVLFQGGGRVALLDREGYSRCVTAFLLAVRSGTASSVPLRAAPPVNRSISLFPVISVSDRSHCQQVDRSARHKLSESATC